LIYTFSHLEVKMISIANQRADDHGTARCGTFVRLPKLAAALESVPGSMHLHIVLDKLDYIDHPASIFSPTGKSSTKPVADKSSWSGTSYTGNILTAVPWPPVGMRQPEDVRLEQFPAVTQKKGTTNDQYQDDSRSDGLLYPR
jgi:hypothetical protein